MKPTSLPKDWIVVTSQSHRNRVYYFNVRTNESSWEMPAEEPNDAGTSKQGVKGKKRKKDSSDEAGTKHRPTTPELEVSKKTKGEERPVLRATRRSSVMTPEQRDPRRRSSAASGSKETPQMQQLREKMLQRQAKGNAVKKSKAPQVTPPLPPIEKSVEKPTTSFGEPQQEKFLTPQMRVMLEKMKDRKAKTDMIRSPVKKQVPVEESKAGGPIRRPRTRSVSSADSPLKSAGIRTRRSSRPIVPPAAATASTSQNCKVNGEEDSAADGLSLGKPTVVLSRLTPNAVRDRSIFSPPASPPTPDKRPTVSPNNKRTSSVSPQKAKTPRLGRSALLRKNLAEERLANLQRSFTEESVVDGPSSIADPPTEDSDDLSNNVSAIFPKISSSPPSIYKNAEFRAKFLRERLHNKSLYEKRMMKTLNVETLPNHDLEANVGLANSFNTSDTFYEEMEWEPIEDEKIMQEIQIVRSHICALSDAPAPQEMPQNSLDLPDGPSRVDGRSLYIVVDTNVFLSNLGAVEEARDAVFKTYGRPMIVVPWTVIRELDFIKDDKSMTRPESLRAKARKAVRFLHQSFSSRHPRILGQTPKDVANNKDKFEIECPDDEILQTCLQIRLSNNCVVLLSYDKNLCNKAMIHDVATLGRDDPLEKVDYLHASEAQNHSFLTQHLLGVEEDPDAVPLHVKELRQAEEIFQEAKEVLTSFLTVVVTKEMQNLYNDKWEKYTIITPPWTVFGVLKCAIKHWMAAVSESFNRRVESLLKKLLEAMQKVPESGRKLTDVSHILENIYELVQTAKVEKHSNIMTRSARSIEALRARCMAAIKQLHEERFHDIIGCKEAEAEEAIRADRAFQQFEEVYAFARDMCGLASEAIGMPCSFPYKKFYPLPTIEDIKEMQPDVAANLNRLLQVLSTALEELNGLHVDHRAVIALYNALATFKPSGKGQLPREFSPLDVFCCLKMKNKVLRSGLGQLQELSSHFCRMATFRCT